MSVIHVGLVAHHSLAAVTRPMLRDLLYAGRLIAVQEACSSALQRQHCFRAESELLM